MQNKTEETGSSEITFARHGTVQNESTGHEKKIGPELAFSSNISKSAAAADLEVKDVSDGDLAGDDADSNEKSANFTNGVPRDSIVQLKGNPSPSVPLKRIVTNQRQWRATSQGYQNFFEFGGFNCIVDSLSVTFLR